MESIRADGIYPSCPGQIRTHFLQYGFIRCITQMMNTDTPLSGLMIPDVEAHGLAITLVDNVEFSMVSSGQPVDS